MEKTCNCIKETEQALKEHLREKNPIFKDMEDFEVGFVNKAYMFNAGNTVVTLPVEIEWQHTTKSGRVSTKRKTQSFTMQYCPFCGKKQE